MVFQKKDKEVIEEKLKRAKRFFRNGWRPKLCTDVEGSLLSWLFSDIQVVGSLLNFPLFPYHFSFIQSDSITPRQTRL